MDCTTVSGRLQFARVCWGGTARALDRLAGRPAGVCAIIEGRDAKDIRKKIAESYATALGVRLAWLMLGEGPCIEGRPDLDPSRESDHAAIGELLRAHAPLPAQGKPDDEPSPLTDPSTSDGVVPASEQRVA